MEEKLINPFSAKVKAFMSDLFNLNKHKRLLIFSSLVGLSPVLLMFPCLLSTDPWCKILGFMAADPAHYVGYYILGFGKVSSLDHEFVYFILAFFLYGGGVYLLLYVVKQLISWKKSKFQENVRKDQLFGADKLSEVSKSDEKETTATLKIFRMVFNKKIAKVVFIICIIPTVLVMVGELFRVSGQSFLLAWPRAFFYSDLYSEFMPSGARYLISNSDFLIRIALRNLFIFVYNFIFVYLVASILAPIFKLLFKE